MTPKIVNIFFHNDFDGMSAAGIFSDFLGWYYADKVQCNFINIDYNELKSFIETKFFEETVVLDFPYHDEAKWWFDHHETSFVSEKERIQYIPSEFKFWDKKAKSCPGLLKVFFKRHYPKYSELSQNRYDELIRYADIIDSAGYESPYEIYDFKNDYIALNYILDRDKSNKLIYAFIESVRYGQINSFFNSSMFISLKMEAHNDLREYISHKNEIISVKENVMILNFLHTKLKIQKYFGYLFYPHINYAVTLSMRGSLYHLGVGYNPWKENNYQNLGSLMRRYQGGGRMNVGAALFQSEASCLNALEEVISVLNRL